MLWGMRPFVLLLFASMALAQQGEDARPLLQQVADAARNVKSWRAEYVVTTETTGEGFWHDRRVRIHLQRLDASLGWAPVCLRHGQRHSGV